MKKHQHGNETVLLWAGRSPKENNIVQELETQGYKVERRLSGGEQPVAQFHGMFSIGYRNITNDFVLSLANDE